MKTVCFGINGPTCRSSFLIVDINIALFSRQCVLCVQVGFAPLVLDFSDNNEACQNVYKSITLT